MPYIVGNVFMGRYVSDVSNCGNTVITINGQYAKRFKTEEEAERYVDDVMDVFEVKE